MHSHCGHVGVTLQSGRPDLNRLRNPRPTKTRGWQGLGPLRDRVLCLSLGRTRRHRPSITWDGAYGRDPTSATAHQPITHVQACTGLNSGASWEQIGNSIGNVSPARPQCENTKVATCEPLDSQTLSTTTTCFQCDGDGRRAGLKILWVGVGNSPLIQLATLKSAA